MKYQYIAIFAGLVILLSAFYLTQPTDNVNKNNIQLGSCTFTLERPHTTDEYAKGLSDREAIAPQAGMWFAYSSPQLPTFWMKGLRFPIDIIWIANRKVVGLNENIPADDGASLYIPTIAIDAALEIAAGRSKECGIQMESVVELPRLSKI